MSHSKICRWFKQNLQIIFFSILLLLLFASITSAREVTLSWDANSEPDMDHYVVYWGVTPGDYIYNSIDNGDDIGIGTEYSVEIPDDEQTYYFAVTAVDVSGLESDFSNEVYIDVALPLNNSWNLITISNGTGLTSIEDAFAKIMDEVISVWAYDGTSWLVYDPADLGASDLFEVMPGQGLWVNMRDNAEVVLIGGAPVDGIALSVGWNLVGFSSPDSRNISDAISSIDGYVDSVWSYQNGQWLVYDPQNLDFSDLTTMDLCYGYWIKMNTSALWTY